MSWSYPLISLRLFSLICPSLLRELSQKPQTVFTYAEVLGCSLIIKTVFWKNAQGKTDTETNFVVTVGFTTKVDHQTTSTIWSKFRSCLMIDLGHETDGNNEMCLGVRFALCIIKALRLARIEHCSGTVVTRFLLSGKMLILLSVSGVHLQLFLRVNYFFTCAFWHCGADQALSRQPWKDYQCWGFYKLDRGHAGKSPCSSLQCII